MRYCKDEEVIFYFFFANFPNFEISAIIVKDRLAIFRLVGQMGGTLELQSEMKIEILIAKAQCHFLSSLR